MDYVTLGRTEIKVCKNGFGALPIQRISFDSAKEILLHAYNSGINFFDTARFYTDSEEKIGYALSDVRDKIYIATKTAAQNADDFWKDLNTSLNNMKTDYIDIYLMHRDNPMVDPGPMVEILNEYHKAGRIGAFGGSNWTHQRIAEANAYASKYGLVPFTVSSPNFGLCNQIDDPWGGGPGCVTISGPANEEARAWYRDNHIPVLAYSSLGRGMFAGIVKSNDIEGAKKILDPFAVKGYCYPENFERLARAEQLAAEKNCSVPQIALAWIMNQDFEVFPLVSAKKASRIVSNVQALDITLTKDEAEWLDLRRDRR